MYVLLEKPASYVSKHRSVSCFHLSRCLFTTVMYIQPVILWVLSHCLGMVTIIYMLQLLIRWNFTPAKTKMSTEKEDDSFPLKWSLFGGHSLFVDNVEKCVCFFLKNKPRNGIISPSKGGEIFRLTDQHFGEFLPGRYMTLNLCLEQTKHNH